MDFLGLFVKSDLVRFPGYQPVTAEIVRRVSMLPLFPARLVCDCSGLSIVAHALTVSVHIRASLFST